MADRIRVALAGAGGIAHVHAPALNALQEQFELAAVFDVNRTAAETVARMYGIPHICGSYEELLALPGIDLIDLCTPSNLHFAQSVQAVQSGHDVVVEKPAAASLSEVDALIALRERSGKRIMPIYQYRFGDGVGRLRLLRRLGLTGEHFITSVETHWHRKEAYYSTWHGKWESEMGGPLVTLAVHAHDILTWVLGPAKSVFARGRTLVNPVQTEDTAGAVLEMMDGSLAVLSATTGSAAQITRHRFCFRHLVAESNTEPYANTADPWKFTAENPSDQKLIDDALAGYVSIPSFFEGQFSLYARAVREGGPLPVTLEDARASIELITAQYASICSGEPVRLPLGTDHPYYDGWIGQASLHLGKSPAA